MTKKQVAIVGAGAAGLMCAHCLADFDCKVSVFEQMPSAGRKLLWAGKTGLNLSNNEAMDLFVSRYDTDVFAHLLRKYDCQWIASFCENLGIETYVGSSGRLFPTQMKAAPFLRAWLADLTKKGVAFFYRHRCVAVHQNSLVICDDQQLQSTQSFDAIVLACGGLSYPQLGSTGSWLNWFGSDEISMMSASNVGVCRNWSPYMNAYFGKPLKGVVAWVNDEKLSGDVVITHYGMESGVIYRLNRALKKRLAHQESLVIYLDLLPHLCHEVLRKKLSLTKKHSLNTLWQKAGLDKTKIALLRECVDKKDWHCPKTMATYIKCLAIAVDGFRPLKEAISTAGGVRFACLSGFCLQQNPFVYVCGEMLDFDAPTGGYLLNACFATGRGCGEQIAQTLNLQTV